MSVHLQTTDTQDLTDAGNMKTEPTDSSTPTVTTEWDTVRADVRANPYDTSLWTRFIDMSEESGDAEKIKEAYEAVLEQYPNSVSFSPFQLNIVWSASLILPREGIRTDSLPESLYEPPLPAFYCTVSVWPFLETFPFCRFMEIIYRLREVSCSNIFSICTASQMFVLHLKCTYQTGESRCSCS